MTHEWNHEEIKRFDDVPTKFHLMTINKSPYVYSPTDNGVISTAQECELHGTPPSVMYLQKSGSYLATG